MDSIEEKFRHFGIVHPIKVVEDSDVKKYWEFCNNLYLSMGKDCKPIDLTQMHVTFRIAHELSTAPIILDIVEKIIGGNILIWATSIFIKPAGSEDYIDWHQDIKYWGFVNADKIVSVWIALTDSNVENGVMKVIPCSHKLPLLEHIETEDKHNQLSRHQKIRLDVPENISIPITLKKGEASIHNSNLVHSSGRNISKFDRIGFVIRYVPPELILPGVKTELILARGKSIGGHLNIISPLMCELDDKSVAMHKTKCMEFLHSVRDANALNSKKEGSEYFCATSSMEFLKLYEVFRELIRAEVDWVKQRMQWMGTVQGLLLAGYGVLLKAYLESPLILKKGLMIITCTSGLLTSVFLLLGILAAGDVIKAISDDWIKLVSEENRRKLPSLRFSIRNRTRGKYSTVGIGYLFISTWFVILIITFLI